MFWWGGVIGNVRRAAFTAGAASFLTLIAFLILRSQALQAPTPYHGVWLNLPTVPKESVGQVSIGMGEWASKQLTEPGLSQQDAALAQSDSPSIPLSEPRQVQHEGPLFAINLESTLEAPDRSKELSSQGISGHRLYVTRFEKDGRIWHRLRLGFFESEGAARQVLADLSGGYPDAWVATIPPREVAASAQAVIYDLPSYSDGPTLLAEASPDSSNQPPDAEGSFLNLLIPENSPSSSNGTDTSEQQRSASENVSEIVVGLVAPGPETPERSHATSAGNVSAGFRLRDSRYKPSASEHALLQRWSQSAGSFQRTGANFALEGRAGLIGYSFGLEGEGTVQVPGPEHALNVANERDQTFAFHGDLSWSTIGSLQFSNKLIEQRDEEQQYIGNFLISRDPDQWRRNTISSSAFTIGLLDNRLRSSTVLNASRYTESEFDEKYLVGHQLLQRMDLDVWRGEDIRLSVFGAYGEANEDYNDFALEEDDKNKKKNPFNEAGRAGIRFGGTVGLGPADVTLAQTDSWDKEGSNGAQKTEHEMTFGLDLNKLKGLVGGLFGDSFWNIAPDSIYASYGIGAVDGGPNTANADRTTDIGAGANWSWGSGYSYLNYWHSYYDNRQSGSEDYDWAGDGFDLGGGMWGNRWNFDGWLSLSRSEQMGEWSEATDLSLGAGVSMSYRPLEFPDLKVTLASDHSRGDYIAYDGTSRSGSWIFTSELDFTKYWAELWGPRRSHLGVVFQLKNDTSLEQWGGSSDQESETEYFIGLKLDVGLQD